MKKPNLPKKDAVKKITEIFKKRKEKLTPSKDLSEFGLAFDFSDLEEQLRNLRVETHLEKLEKFLNQNRIHYEVGSTNGITPSIHIEFDDNGNTVKS